MAVGRTSSTGLPWLVASSDLTNGSDIIYPTSVAGTGVTLLGGQVSFSAATSVSVNGCFTSVYENYRIVISCTTASATNNHYFRLRSAGTDTSTSTYQYVYGRNSSIGTNDAAGGTTTYFPISYSDSSAGSHAALDIFRGNSSGNVGMRGLAYGLDAARSVTYNIGGLCNQATAHDGFTYYPLTGNITGTIRVYGMRNY